MQKQPDKYSGLALPKRTVAFLTPPAVLAVIIFVITFLAQSPIQADTVYMRNGKVIYGKINNQTGSHVFLRTESGVKQIPKSNIRQITYESYEEAIKKKKRDIARRKARERRRRQERARKAAELRKKYEESRRKREQADARIARQAWLYQQAQYRAARLARLRERVAKKEIPKPEEPISFTDFTWRSAVLPGWGHVRMGKTWTGYGWGAASLFAIANIIRTRGPAVRANQDNQAQLLANNTALLAAGSQILASGSADTNLTGNLTALAIFANQQAAGPYNDLIDDYHRSLAIAAGVYGVQLLHVLFDGLIWERGGVIGQYESGLPEFNLAVYPADPARTSLMSRRNRRAGLNGELRFSYRF